MGLGYKQGEAQPIHLSLDNQAAIYSSYNPENHQRTRHIDRKHYFIRKLVELGRIVVPFVRSDQNLADFFTKPLRPARFFSLRDKIMNVRHPATKYFFHEPNLLSFPCLRLPLESRFIYYYLRSF